MSAFRDPQIDVINSIVYWQNVADTDTDEKVRTAAKETVALYSNDLMTLEGVRKRYEERAARRAMYVPPPKLTALEILCAPLWFAQVAFTGMLFSGMWIAIGIVVFGLLWGVFH